MAEIKPAPGHIARFRQRLYLIEDVTRASAQDDSSLVKLSCVDDESGEAWDTIAQRGYDPLRIFAAYLNTLRWNCVTATNPRLFPSPFRAGIKLDAYQLEPLRKPLLLPRVNLFIAGDVGLGKTIEAGLITRQLLGRKKVPISVVTGSTGAR